MLEDDAPDPTATAAEIARLAGVTRAAVSNWRRRRPDFPAPVGGTAASPLFSLVEVQRWLDGQREGREVNSEVRLWQALRTAFGSEMVEALAAVGEHLLGEGAGLKDRAACEAMEGLLAERTPVEVMDGLVARLLDSTARAALDGASTLQLARAVGELAGETTGTVFDPACGIGSLLVAVGGGNVRGRLGQDMQADAVRLAQARVGLSAASWAVPPRLAAGDSLRADASPDLRADLVVCEPPTAVADWGREQLLVDPRWEAGVPSRGESELAWLQHCYHHTAPGGRAVVVLPASVAHRRSGRRIRAELVRRGCVTAVVALPPGLAASHALPLHVWILSRPSAPGNSATTVRMVDLSASSPDGPWQPKPHQEVEVPLIDLLDDDVDLTPGRYVREPEPDYAAEYVALRGELDLHLRKLRNLLPDLAARADASNLDEGVPVAVSDLLAAGLVTLDGEELASNNDQLDPDYVRGFAASPANTRRGTSSSGTFRADLRSARLPRMDIKAQQRYGNAFRLLGMFQRELAELARIGDRATQLARDGLTSGALDPEPARDSGDNKQQITTTDGDDAVQQEEGRTL
ncbi:N-6 DNA methylase [Kitasatospora purpeofusca]|uniref:N-6 DNA methylase n=1 Tax=Kitasatospora purpeofusca TaxID=67352 RepID=UPI0022514353|nr:N-6 DNA methylase [Kitasatospora purpeofusca]MCX4752544.1 SAM-dependent methyltransferase [Kitasatospora purpeofusca]WSR32114.1 SAM-dependent methyltransferase [Kitasatospora purpeofusca]